MNPALCATAISPADIPIEDLHTTMVPKTTLMTLPPELRERVYKEVAKFHQTRYIRGKRAYEMKASTPPIAATCRLIRHEYDPVGQRATTVLDFKAIDFDVRHIIAYFRQYVGAKRLDELRQNKAEIHVNLALHDADCGSEFNMYTFCHWARFLDDIRLPVRYHASASTWLRIRDAERPSLISRVERCKVLIADREDRWACMSAACEFDKAVGKAYPLVIDALRRSILERFTIS